MMGWYAPRSKPPSPPEGGNHESNLRLLDQRIQSILNHGSVTIEPPRHPSLRYCPPSQYALPRFIEVPDLDQLPKSPSAATEDHMSQNQAQESLRRQSAVTSQAPFQDPPTTLTQAPFQDPFVDPMRHGDVAQQLVLTRRNNDQIGNENSVARQTFSFPQTWEAIGGHSNIIAQTSLQKKRSKVKGQSNGSAKHKKSSEYSSREETGVCSLQKTHTDATLAKKSRKRQRKIQTPSHPKLSEFSEESFTGIDECNICNLGQSEEALEVFLTHLRQQSHMAFTLLLPDPFDEMKLSSCFVTSSKRYCTDKGPACHRWYCTCSSNSRGFDLARAPLLGLMVICPALEDFRSQCGDFMCCILPLGRCLNIEGDLEPIPRQYVRLSGWPSIPFNCQVSLDHRWRAFRQILMGNPNGSKRIIGVTYQSIVSLLPFHFSQWHDANSDSLDLIIDQIWDLKLVSWMTKSVSSDQELEWDAISANFSHLSHESSTSPEGASDFLKSMLHIKDKLILLFKIYEIVDPTLRETGLHASFQTIEAPLQSVLAAMEMHGVGFLPRRFIKLQRSLETQTEKLTAEAREIAQDSELLLSSPQQVSHLLFDILRLKLPASAAQSLQHPTTDNRSTSEAALEAMKSHYGESTPRIIHILLEFRSLNKMLTSFIRPLPAFSREDEFQSSKIHPMWIQTAVRTGRLSCRKPNLQQIPKKGCNGVVPRNAFCASSEEMCLFSCDYSQNEVRILAHMSNDPALIRLFTDSENVDIYKQMSSSVTNKAIDEVTDAERSQAKQVVLAMLYGMGLNQVASKLGINVATARRIFDNFYARFSGVKQWMQATRQNAKRNGYITTIAGRRRYLEDINSTDDSKRTQAERQAINSVIQGSAADLIKFAMLKISRSIMNWTKDTGRSPAPRLVLQIHDELLFEVTATDEDVQHLKDTIMRCCARECENDLKLKVPLKLDCAVGKSWGESMREF